jgi:hypothetical protein
MTWGITRLILGRWRTLAACLALASSLSSGWLAVTHDLSDDAACAGEPWLPTPPAGGAHISSAGRSPGSGHCDICHWLRSLRTLGAHALFVPHVILPADRIESSAITREGHLGVVRVPARAPPV